jgi:hypothetical protein
MTHNNQRTLGGSQEQCRPNLQTEMSQNNWISQTHTHTEGPLAVAFCTCGRRIAIALAPLSRWLNQVLPQSFGREFDGVKRQAKRAERNE